MTAAEALEELEGDERMASCAIPRMLRPVYTASELSDCGGTNHVRLLSEDSSALTLDAFALRKAAYALKGFRLKPSSLTELADMASDGIRQSIVDFEAIEVRATIVDGFRSSVIAG